MSAKTHEVAMGPKEEKALAKVVEAICLEHNTHVLTLLDKRLTYRDAVKEGDVAYGAYARYVLADGHVIYVNLRTMVGTYSKTANKYAQGQGEKKLARKAKAAARKADRELKAAAKKSGVTGAQVDKAIKTEAKKLKRQAKEAVKPKAAKKVKFDPKLSTLGPDNTTTPAKD